MITQISTKTQHMRTLLLLFCLFLTSCSALKQDDNLPTTKASDYFPIRANTSYTYTGSGNEYASYKVYTDYTSQNKFQRRIDNGGTTISEVISLLDDKVVLSYSNVSQGARESYIDNDIQNTNGDEILLMDPIKQGTSWSLPDGGTRTITKTDQSITTDLGTYQTIEVETKSNQTTIKQYYAVDIGLIKSIYVQAEGDISSVLTAIDSDAHDKQLITFFFPNFENNSYLGITREVLFQTNDEPSKLIEQTYKSIVEESLSTILTINIHIESIKRSNETTVTVDISKSYYEELSAGSNYEAMLVQSFVNTIGHYYGVDNVIVTVGGKPYESGHFYMLPQEPFKVDMTKVVYQ